MIKTIIFDLGGVLIDWNPNHLYKKIFPDPDQRKTFLTNVCSPAWNEMQDAGRPIKDANKILIEQFPEFRNEILAFYGRWEEMLGGPIPGTVQILKKLVGNNGHRIVALTNWSAETFPVAKSRYDFLNLFEGILVSGEEKMKKPDPKIYQLTLSRFDIIPSESIFIDDSERNIRAAEREGIKGIVFSTPEKLILDLEEFGIRVS